MESVDEVLKKATKVIVDTSGKGVSSVVPYMPISEFKPRPAYAAPRRAARPVASGSGQMMSRAAARRRGAGRAGGFSPGAPRSTSWAKAEQALVVRLGAPIGVVASRA